MEPRTPEPQRSSSIPTFDRVQASFRGNPTIATFQCLVNNTRTNACEPLEAIQVQHASEILCSDLPRSLRDVWDVVNCLVCIQHQGDRIYIHKHRVMDRWQDEFPQLDFSSSPMPRSKFSLCSTPRGARRSTPLRYTTAGTRSPSVVQEGTPSRRHGNNERVTPSPEPQSVDAELSGDEDVDMDDGPVIATPNSTRPSTPVHLETQGPRNGNEEDRTPNLDYTPTQSRTPSPNTRQRAFVPGTSSTWPLWRVRQEVRHLLFESLPSPRAHGILYAVESPLHNKVKIGYTMRRSFNERLRELEKQHGAPLGHHWYLPGIPYVQLLRLEELVHADLAKYQCDYSVPFGQGNGCRVHREWFDLDLATAQKTMEFWWAAMRHLRIKPGSELRERWRDRLTTEGAMFEVNGSNTRGAFDDYQDHEKTLQLWTELLQRPRRGSKTWMARWWWMIIAFAATRLCGTMWESAWLYSLSQSMMLFFALWTSWSCT